MITLKVMVSRRHETVEPIGSMSDALLAPEDAPEQGAFFVPRPSLEIVESELLPTRTDPRQIHTRHNTVKATMEGPSEPRDEVPTILIHGYFGIKTSYFDQRRWMAGMGKLTVSYGESRFLVNPLQLLEMHIASIEAIMDEYGYDQYDFSGHSMGGWLATLVALRNPSRVRSVTFNASVGMEPHNTPVMVERLAEFWRDEVLPVIWEKRRATRLAFQRIALRGLEYVVSNPLLILVEGLAVSNCDIRDQIPLLRQAGIKTAAFGYPADRLVPASRLEEHARDLVDEFAILPNLRAGHTAPQTHAAEVAQMHVDLTDYWFSQPDQLAA